MKKGDINVCIMRVAGTNCDAETKRAFDDLGVKATVVHSNEIVKKETSLTTVPSYFPAVSLTAITLELEPSGLKQL